MRGVRAAFAIWLCTAAPVLAQDKATPASRCPAPHTAANVEPFPTVFQRIGGAGTQVLRLCIVVVCLLVVRESSATGVNAIPAALGYHLIAGEGVVFSAKDILVGNTPYSKYISLTETALPHDFNSTFIVSASECP
jgi:hypothetical protein